MKRTIRLTESDLTNIVRRVIKEQSSPKSLITEAVQAAIDDAEERIANGEKPDPLTMGKIKKCIAQKQLTSLMFLTTGAGAAALGVIAMLIGSGFGFVPGAILAISGAIVLFITSLSEKDGGLGSNPAADVKALLGCIGM